MRTITWTNRGHGYEVSSRGDRRFSAFYAIMPDGRNLETHYQCDVKGYKTWRDGKGRPLLDISIDLFAEYLKLWEIWSENNQPLIAELLEVVRDWDDVLKDSFANTRVNQAHALSIILNKKLSEGAAT